MTKHQLLFLSAQSPLTIRVCRSFCCLQYACIASCKQCTRNRADTNAFGSTQPKNYENKYKFWEEIRILAKSFTKIDVLFKDIFSDASSKTQHARHR